MAQVARRDVLSSVLLAVAGAAASVRASGHVPPRDLDRTALRRLDELARGTKSDAVLVFHHGNLVYQYYSGTPAPIFTMSCTKSIVSLAVGQAIAEGKIKGIDQPVSDFFPEMKQGRKAPMTIRHLLTMTSGIQNNGTGDEVYAAPDIVKLAIAAELTTVPGAKFEYNNKSVNLLSGIMHVATKQPLDDYVRDRFFEPMRIASWNWMRDDDGNASAMADLALYPADLAKFGLLAAQRGQWNGKQLVPVEWTQSMGTQSQPFEPQYGLLWWRFPAMSAGTLTTERVNQLETAGLGPEFTAAFRKLAGRTFSSQSDWHRALAEVFPDWETTRLNEHNVIDHYASDAPEWRYGDFDGLGAIGSLGQYLVVFPSRQLVAVRMIKGFKGYSYAANRFENFPDVVRALTPLHDQQTCSSDGRHPRQCNSPVINCRLASLPEDVD